MKLLLSVGTLCLFLLSVLAAAAGARAGDAQPIKSSSLTIEQARREVRLLDDLYKSAVVLINDTFVKDGNGASAGDAARLLFAGMREKGWHDARLVDATGKPMNDDNIAQDAFERLAIQRILKGETYVDEVVRDGDKSYLRAATVVPVINARCISCHPGNKVGGVLGAISYKIPLR